MYALHVMPALLLQKPSRSLKSKDHVDALKRRLKKWINGEFLQLLREATAPQSRLPKIGTMKNINMVSRTFREYMSKGNVNSAIKPLSNNMEGGVLPSNKQTIDLLKMKYPVGKAVSEDTKLHGPLSTVENLTFYVIDDSMVLEVVIITREGSGPSGMDEDGWRRILVSRDYGDAGNDLRKVIASLIKKICIEEIDDSSLSPLMASRLVPLNKNSSLRPIGVGQVLRQMMGKVVVSAFFEDVTTPSSDAQMCGRSSGSEAAIHAMRRMFQLENSDAFILVDAANAFNNLNRKVFLHNIKFISPEIATYLNNCYLVPARLFVSGGLELTSREGST